MPEKLVGKDRCEFAAEIASACIDGAFRVIYRIGSEEVLILTVRRASRLLDPSELGEK